MREFNLEEAKAGKAVCTRGGSPARIVCYDLKDLQYEILAAVEVEKGREIPLSYTSKGKYRDDDEEDMLDLMMASEKHEGWANILVGSACKSDLNRYFSGIFTTKEEAQRYNTDNIVDCVKIEWEE